MESNFLLFYRKTFVRQEGRNKKAATSVKNEEQKGGY